MSRLRPAARVGERGCNGFVMMEVMAAVVILGIVVTSLCGALQRSRDASAGLREGASLLSADSLQRSYADSWSWGPMISEARWSAGPCLVIFRGEDCAESDVIGVWVDGWAIGEWDAPGDEGLRIGPQTWADLSGDEVVLRARSGGGAWGPPYRCEVPDSYGVAVTASAAASVTEVVPEFEDATTTVHTRCSGIPEVSASWTTGLVAHAIHQVVLVLAPHGRGSCALEAYGALQSWPGYEGWGLDVYW